jgi:hypothetical protein
MKAVNVSSQGTSGGQNQASLSGSLDGHHQRDVSPAAQPMQL